MTLLRVWQPGRKRSVARFGLLSGVIITTRPASALKEVTLLQVSWYPGSEVWSSLDMVVSPCIIVVVSAKHLHDTKPEILHIPFTTMHHSKCAPHSIPASIFNIHLQFFLLPPSHSHPDVSPHNYSIPRSSHPSYGTPRSPSFKNIFAIRILCDFLIQNRICYYYYDAFATILTIHG